MTKASFTPSKAQKINRLEQTSKLGQGIQPQFKYPDPQHRLNPLKHYFCKMLEDAPEGTRIAASSFQADLWEHTYQHPSNPAQYDRLQSMANVTVWNPGPAITQDEEMRPVIEHWPTGLLMLLPQGSPGKNYLARVTEVPNIEADSSCADFESGTCITPVLKAQLGTCTLTQEVGCQQVTTTDLRETYVAYSDDFEPAVDDIILVHETPYACAFLSEIICTNSGSDSTSLGDCCEVCDPRPSSFQVVVSGVTPILMPIHRQEIQVIDAQMYLGKIITGHGNFP